MILNHFKCLHIDVDCVVSVALPSRRILRSFVHHNVSPVHTQRHGALRSNGKYIHKLAAIAMNDTAHIRRQRRLSYYSRIFVHMHSAHAQFFWLLFRLLFFFPYSYFGFVWIWYGDATATATTTSTRCHTWYLLLLLISFLYILLLREADDNVKCWRQANRIM